MVSDLSGWSAYLRIYLYYIYLSFTIRTKYKHADPRLIKRARELEVQP